MKKYFLISLVIFGLLVALFIVWKMNPTLNFSSTHTKIKTNTTANKKIIIKIDEQTNGGNDFYFDMLIQDAYAKLEELKVKINEIEITNDPDSWDWGNREIWAAEYGFTFDKAGKLYEISYLSMPTTLGLKREDSVEQMKKIYGNHFNFYPNETVRGYQDAYEYKIGNHYFRVYVTKGKVNFWGISKYKYDLSDAPQYRNLGIRINEKFADKTGTFYLGMTKQSACSKLDQMKIIYTEEEEDRNSKAWNFGDIIIILKYERIALYFDKKDKLLYEIVVPTKYCPTVMGLKTGDPLDNIQKFYGRNYTLYKPDNYVKLFEYKMDGQYLLIVFSTSSNRIENWRISKYSYNKNNY